MDISLLTGRWSVWTAIVLTGIPRFYFTMSSTPACPSWSYTSHLVLVTLIREFITRTAEVLYTMFAFTGMALIKSPAKLPIPTSLVIPPDHVFW